jgi:succinoglycan biosynthesis transport protein ExoP
VQPRQYPQQSGDTVDLREYAAILRRRSMVIAILAVLGLGLALGYSELQTPIYTATAKVLVNPPPGDSSQNLNNLISVDTEAQVVKSEPIADSAAQELGSPLIPTQLLRHVSVKTATNTFILDISYWDPDPSQAAHGANAFAKAYLAYKTQQAADLIDQQKTSIEDQVAQLDRQQADQNQILETASPGTIEYRNAQDALSQISVQYAVLASSLAQLPQIVNPGQVILPAVEPKAPSSPKVPMNAAVGLFLGLLGGVVTAFVLDRMDDRVHRSSDLEYYLDAPVLAFVPHVKGPGRERISRLIVHLDPRSPVAEAYRTIRAGVLSMAHKRDLRVLGITSPVQGEGKSMTSANIAAALGQTDKRVLVLSADIRKPRIHEFFGAENDRGLSEVLEGSISFENAVQEGANNIWVLAGGHFPSQPAELLQSPAMGDLLRSVRTQFDFVIVDCPPVLGLADCLAVLPHVDAVLLVVQADKTRGGAILEVGDRLERVGVSIDAVILNDLRVARGRPGHGTYGYYMASEEYLRPDEIQPRQGALRFVQPRTAMVEEGGNGVPQRVENSPEQEVMERERPKLAAGGGTGSPVSPRDSAPVRAGEPLTRPSEER